MDQREYFRVKGSFPISYRCISEEEHEELGERLHTELSLPESPSYHYLPSLDSEPSMGGLERLLPFFQEILFKLDLAIELLTSREETWKGPNGRLIDISGAGLQFSCAEAVPTSSLLEMRFQLPGQWGRYIHCAGAVTRTERCEQGWAVACEFTHICESDRERVIQYAFQVSCKVLRENRRLEDSVG